MNRVISSLAPHQLSVGCFLLGAFLMVLGACWTPMLATQPVITSPPQASSEAAAPVPAISPGMGDEVAENVPVIAQHAEKKR